jgi:F-type H+-transporting ATPase subunit c
MINIKVYIIINIIYFRRYYKIVLNKKMLAAAKYIGAGLACSGLIGAGAGIGLIFSSLIASTARNPQIRGQLFSFAILGFALAEATGLFSLMIAFLLLYS